MKHQQIQRILKARNKKPPNQKLLTMLFKRTHREPIERREFTPIPPAPR
jgi:hypothetical protein